jgi:hypothetical protein
MTDLSYFSYLSDDEIFNIALKLNIEDVGYYCLYNSRFNKIVCENNWFWKEKFLSDFGLSEYDYVDDWKTLYKNYGSVYVFGNNSVNQLGFNNNFENVLIPTKILNFQVKAISAGYYHTVAIDFNNDVWGFGYNNSGSLGLVHRTNQGIPTKIPHFKVKSISTGVHTVAIDLNNDVWVN